MAVEARQSLVERLEATAGLEGHDDMAAYRDSDRFAVELLSHRHHLGDGEAHRIIILADALGCRGEFEPVLRRDPRDLGFIAGIDADPDVFQRPGLPDSGLRGRDDLVHYLTSQ